MSLKNRPDPLPQHSGTGLAQNLLRPGTHLSSAAVQPSATTKYKPRELRNRLSSKFERVARYPSFHRGKRSSLKSPRPSPTSHLRRLQYSVIERGPFHVVRVRRLLGITTKTILRNTCLTFSLLLDGARLWLACDEVWNLCSPNALCGVCHLPFPAWRAVTF